MNDTKHNQWKSQSMRMNYTNYNIDSPSYTHQQKYQMQKKLSALAQSKSSRKDTFDPHDAVNLSDVQPRNKSLSKLPINEKGQEPNFIDIYLKQADSYKLLQNQKKNVSNFIKGNPRMQSQDIKPRFECDDTVNIRRSNNFENLTPEMDLLVSSLSIKKSLISNKIPVRAMQMYKTEKNCLEPNLDLATKTMFPTIGSTKFGETFSPQTVSNKKSFIENPIASKKKSTLGFTPKIARKD